MSITSPDPTQDAPCLGVSVAPAPIGPRYRNTGGRVFRVAGSGDRWYVAQERRDGLREAEHYGQYSSSAEAQAALDGVAKAMHMVEVPA